MLKIKVKPYQQILLPIILIIPTIFYPISDDIAIFALGGKLIANGGSLYADYVDMKPPLLFYIFAIIYKTFSISEIGLRLFDFLYQSIVIISFYFLTRKLFFDTLMPLFSVTAYSVSFTLSTFNYSMNPDNFAALPLVFYLYIMIKQKLSYRHYIILGIIIGLISGLKITISVIYIATILILVLNQTRNISSNNFEQKDETPQKGNWKPLLTGISLMTISFIIAMIIPYIPTLLNSTAFDNYKLIMKYTSFHAGLPPLSVDMLKNSIKSLTIFWGDKYSLLFTFAALSGIGILFKQYKNIGYQFRGNDDFINYGKTTQFAGKILVLCFTLIFILFLSVIIERKFAYDHFSRMFIPLSIITGMGLNQMFDKFKNLIRQKDFTVRFMLILILFISILFSPVFRYTQSIIPAVKFIQSGEKYDELFQDDSSSQFLRVTHKKIATFLCENTSGSDTVSIIAITGNYIKYFCQKPHYTKFAHSAFYFANIDKGKWREDFRNELKHSKYLVIHTNDRHPILTGHSLSSWELFQKDNFAFNYLRENFKFVERMGQFVIYEKSK